MDMNSFFRKYDAEIRRSSILASMFLAGYLFFGDKIAGVNRIRDKHLHLGDDTAMLYLVSPPRKASPLEHDTIIPESLEQAIQEERESQANQVNGEGGEQEYIIQQNQETPLPQRVQPPARRNYQTTDFSQDSDARLLARMIYGEARGCTQNERIAVGYTAVNRLQQPRRFGRTLYNVILRQLQYSCFNRNDPNRVQLMNPERQVFEECLNIAEGILSRTHEDPTQGATHYFNPGTANPSWANRLTRIGRVNNSRHVFYREE